jgi:hypothetical protein
MVFDSVVARILVGGEFPDVPGFPNQPHLIATTWSLENATSNDANMAAYTDGVHAVLVTPNRYYAAGHIASGTSGDIVIWHPLGSVPVVSLPVQALALAHSGETGILYAGLQNAYNVDGPASTTVTNQGLAPAYPVLTILGGNGQLVSLENLTTGARINFRSHFLSSGERLTLNLDPVNLSLKSSLVGDLYYLIAPGSDVDRFLLQPGVNRIGLFIANASGVEATLTWKQAWPGIS